MQVLHFVYMLYIQMLIPVKTVWDKDCLQNMIMLLSVCSDALTGFTCNKVYG